MQGLGKQFEDWRLCNHKRGLGAVISAVYKPKVKKSAQEFINISIWVGAGFTWTDFNAADMDVEEKTEYIPLNGTESRYAKTQTAGKFQTITEAYEEWNYQVRSGS